MKESKEKRNTNKNKKEWKRNLLKFIRKIKRKEKKESKERQNKNKKKKEWKTTNEERKKEKGNK